MHVYWFCLLLGLVAAMPLAAVGIEAIRRNLHHGFWPGFLFVSGASCVDTVYITLLGLGVMTFITHANVLRWIGVGGALVLFYFAWMIFRSTQTFKDGATKKKSLGRQWLEGVMMTTLNPYTIIF